MNNKIELKAISELEGMNFFIPNYQRGYRWTEQQVKDLLNDVEEHINKNNNGFYCIQPLVVKKSIINENEYSDELKKLDPSKKDTLISLTESLLSEHTRWEVIDGQQRLTTIFLILRNLQKKESSNLFSIEYETRAGSKDFLQNINDNEKYNNIDFYHISEANSTIQDWLKKFEGKNNVTSQFLNTLLTDVKFIWYESVDENPIEVFTRLNIGKIALTNAELIKALLLSNSNFEDSDFKSTRLQQQEIATSWDHIEYTLQNDEFWLFIHNIGYDKPTRIEFIFDIICNKNYMKLSDDDWKEIGDDEYKTFRYFYKVLKTKEEEKKGLLEIWKEVTDIFRIFNEWYNDLKLYHYIGYLLGDFWKKDKGQYSIDELLSKWKGAATKSDFIETTLCSKIKEGLKDCSDLNKQYEVNGNPKTQCRLLLLLFNIETVISQGKLLIENDRYNQAVFYKFPFHLFKKEKWDVEHIDSNTENPLDRHEDQKEWLMSTLLSIDKEDLRDRIMDFLKPSKPQEKNSFENLYTVIIESDESELSHSKLTQEEKNRIWNYTLLDARTNRSYGNSIFPTKRRVIIGKDQGKTFKVNEKFEVMEEKGAIAFIPPCTKNIFTKYYSTTVDSLREWTKKDAESYKLNIENTLKKFLK